MAFLYHFLSNLWGFTLPSVTADGLRTCGDISQVVMYRTESWHVMFHNLKMDSVGLLRC